MRDRVLCFPLFGCLLIIGCGEAAKLPSVPAPHGGVVYSVGEGAGFVELLAETKGDPRDRKANSQLTAYFLDASGRKAMDPAPTDVKAIFNIPKENVRDKAKSFSMTPMPDSGDPLGNAKFVSPAGAFGGGELVGQLEATLAGVKTSISFELR